MHLAPLLAFALTLGSTVAQSCGAYPLLDTKLSKCATATAFCTSLLGRAGTTTTVSLATYTTTVPKSTFTYLQVSTKTFSRSTFVPTRTETETQCAAPSTLGLGLGFNRMAQPAAAAAGSSCGLGQYSSAWVSTVCGCAIDSTIYAASTTKRVKKGTTLKITSSTTSYTTVSTSYSTTATATSTILSNNCYPPANSSCLYPGSCDTSFTFYYCGSNDYYNCACGLDSHNLGYCFYADYCENLPACVNDYDCASGSFCLYESCCDGPVCSKADVCLGDQGITTASTFGGAPTAVPVPDHGAGTNWGNAVVGKKRGIMRMTPFGPRYD